MHPQESKPVFMYLATDGTLMKIGISTNPLRRNWKPDGLFVHHDRIKMLYITNGSRELERQTHERFSAMRYRHNKTREWFHCNDKIYKYFRSLPNATEEAREVVRENNKKLFNKRHNILDAVCTNC